MKKVISWIIFSINLLVVLIFLSISVFFIYINKSPEKTIFNMKPYIINSSYDMYDIKEKSFILVNKEITNAKKEDYILITDKENNDGIAIAKVLFFDTDVIFYESNGITSKIGVEAEELIGKISFKSSSIGNLIFSLAHGENIKMTYITIIICYLLLNFILILFYTLAIKKQRRKSISTENIELVSEVIEAKPEEINSDDNNIEEEELDVVFVKSNTPIEEEIDEQQNKTLFKLKSYDNQKNKAFKMKEESPSINDLLKELDDLQNSLKI